MTTLAFSAPLGASAQRRAGTVAAPHVLDANSLGDHLDRLYRAALGLTGSPADADDLVQDVCVRVLAKPRLVSGDDDLGYLLRVLRNTFIKPIQPGLDNTVNPAKVAEEGAKPGGAGKPPKKPK